MNKEEILIIIKEIQCRYSIPALEQNYTDKDYACKQFEKLVIHLANQQEQKDKEIERLNSIINKLEKYLNNFNFEFYCNCSRQSGKAVELGARLNNDFILDKLTELKGE